LPALPCQWDDNDAPRREIVGGRTSRRLLVTGDAADLRGELYRHLHPHRCDALTHAAASATVVALRQRRHPSRACARKGGGPVPGS